MIHIDCAVNTLTDQASNMESEVNIIAQSM